MVSMLVNYGVLSGAFSRGGGNLSQQRIVQPFRQWLIVIVTCGSSSIEANSIEPMLPFRFNQNLMDIQNEFSVSLS